MIGKAPDNLGHPLKRCPKTFACPVLSYSRSHNSALDGMKICAGCMTRKLRFLASIHHGPRQRQSRGSSVSRRAKIGINIVLKTRGGCPLTCTDTTILASRMIDYTAASLANPFSLHDPGIGGLDRVKALW